MSRQLGPVGASLDELRGYLQRGSSGTFYLVGVDDSVAAIVIASGVVESVSYQGRHGDFAVELLKNLKSASSTFESAPRRVAKESELSKRAVRWLTGADAGAAAPGRGARSAALPADRYRGLIEAACFAYFGPIATIVCDGVFKSAADVNSAIDALAAKLAPDEAAAFRLAIARLIEEAPVAAEDGLFRDFNWQRQTIEAIAFAFLGPIAGVLCAKAFAGDADLSKVINEIAAHLPSHEAASFRREVARETGSNWLAGK